MEILAFILIAVFFTLVNLAPLNINFYWGKKYLGTLHIQKRR